MRIVQLNPFYFPYAGGIERRIRSVARRLARRHDVHVVTAQLPGTSPGAQPEDGFTVHRVPSSFPLRRFYNPPPVRTRGLHEVLARIGPDVIDYHFRWSPSWNRAFRGTNGTARVVTYHNTYGEGLGLLGALSRLNDRIYMRTLRTARRVVCVSDRVRTDLAQRGVPPPRLAVVHNAVETQEIQGVTGAPKGAPAHPFVVAVGRMVALKGFDVLIDALARSPEPLDLVLVGQGPERGRLRRRAARLGVAHRVHLPGWVEEDEKIRLLKSAAAYAHPARFESFPFSLLEAMAAGAPVVSARVGGIPEAVGDAGPLLGHDPADWATALSHLALDLRARAAARRASLQRIQRFDWDRITKALETLYEEARRA